MRKRGSVMSDNLADSVINQIEREKQGPIVGQWGIDEVGFPWPKPVNNDAIVARIFLRHDNIFKIEREIFVDRNKVQQNKNSLIALCGRPKIIEWADKADDEAFWKELRLMINTDWPIIWERIIEIAPIYNRDYIRLNDRMVWGKDESDILLG